MTLGNSRMRVDGWDSANMTLYQFQGRVLQGHSPNALSLKQQYQPQDLYLVGGTVF